MLKMLSLYHLSIAVKASQKQTTHKTKMTPPNIKKERLKDYCVFFSYLFPVSSVEIRILARLHIKSH